MSAIKGLANIALVFSLLTAFWLPANAFAADKPFTFGLLLVGPHDDQGLSQSHYEGGKYVVENVPGTKMIYIDRVNPTDRPSVTIRQLVDDLVQKGAKLIIANSIDMKAGIREAALANPGIYFLQISGDDILAGKGLKNLSSLTGRMEYGKMMAGFAAAMTTKTGKIGYIGPVINEETRRLASACYLGARYAWNTVLKKDPLNLKFQVNWIGFWYHVPGVSVDPDQFAATLFNTGYDVVISGIAPATTEVVAKQKNQEGKTVWAIPYDHVGACDSAPDVCLGVPFFNWGPGYLKFVKAAMSGNWKAEWLWLDPDWSAVNDPHATVVGFVSGPALSDIASVELNKFTRNLEVGQINLFRGPLNYQDGTPFVGANQTASDMQIWYMKQLLQGMDGRSTPK
jgi:simple sugar transport system substrate-binding protein